MEERVTKKRMKVILVAPTYLVLENNQWITMSAKYVGVKVGDVISI